MDHWTKFLAAQGLENRLQRGLRYARQGHVLNIEISKSRITARVQGSRARPYRVEIRLKAFPPEIWDSIITIIASQAALSAAIITGEMPEDIENIFHKAGFSLFPQSLKEIAAECSCPDIANPCKHIAAIFYILGQELTKDPFVIFLLRGKTKDSLLADLTKKRSSLQQALLSPAPDNSLRIENSPQAPNLAHIIKNYWQTGDNLADLPLATNPPQSPCLLLHRLGKPPDWPDEPDFIEVMAPLYEHVSRQFRS
ncbi:SWIM zinc finger family protein [Sporomusa acidovorans]|uniref:SWIM-type domain-containing protein n=1 Tax=Sporomusa acidovorans (strain ATCC 49682 / DSM 3132 / Mol) TaxID=1123286 RepID=A0ABZ3J6W6_SPOA4|nr:SWIM zinc finger family protein [Sporomusa acidovorans]OZC19376.1 hypothetical protein SPACI_29660 [Sporomusa acidovorans DSM 3132]SDD78825.1 Uncharacterized conserved protein, contains Zn finger domain [Sporomusa acidovorans]